MNISNCPYFRRALLVDVIASEGYNPDALTCNLLKPKINTAFVGLLMLSIETVTRSCDFYPFHTDNHRGSWLSVYSLDVGYPE